MDLRDKAIERDIDGVKYRAWPLPWGKARPLCTKALKTFAAIAAGSMRSADGAVDLDSALARLSDAGRLAAGLEAAQGAITDADLEAYAKAFGDAAEYEDGEKWLPLTESVQNLHFAGRPDAFWIWVLFGMEANGFYRFFSGSAIAEAMKSLPLR